MLKIGHLKIDFEIHIFLFEERSTKRKFKMLFINLFVTRTSDLLQTLSVLNVKHWGQ